MVLAALRGLTQLLPWFFPPRLLYRTYYFFPPEFSLVSSFFCPFLHTGECLNGWSFPSFFSHGQAPSSFFSLSQSFSPPVEERWGCVLGLPPSVGPIRRPRHLPCLSPVGFPSVSPGYSPSNLSVFQIDACYVFLLPFGTGARFPWLALDWPFPSAW